MIRNTRFFQAAIILAATAFVAPAFAQSPTTPATPATTSPPAASSPPPAAANPAPAAPAPSAPAATPAAPSSPPAAQAVPPPPAVQNADAFGEETMLTAKTVVVMKGSGDWDSAFDTIQDTFKTINAFLDKQGSKPSGPALIVYTSTDDAGFTFLAEVPVDEAPKGSAKNISVGKSPEGKVLKFVHHGSYDNMDNTYEAITNYLDDKKLEAKDTFIEEYVTDAIKTPEDNLIINIFVQLK